LSEEEEDGACILTRAFSDEVREEVEGMTGRRGWVSAGNKSEREDCGVGSSVPVCSSIVAVQCAGQASRGAAREGVTSSDEVTTRWGRRRRSRLDSVRPGRESYVL
jgi:hypothetical protein